MPELPEVETIKKALEPYLVGRTFSGVRISDTGLFRGYLWTNSAVVWSGAKLPGYPAAANT